MKVVAVYSIKGGVGKSTTAANLAWASAEAGRRTLLVDLDPQGASSWYFRVRPRKAGRAGKVLEGGDRLLDSVRGSDHDKLDLVPAHLSFRNFDLLLDDMKKSRQVLQKALRSVRRDYDVVVLDAPPNITLLSENLFTAADLILVPVVPTPLSRRTWEQLLEFFGQEGFRRKKLRAFFNMARTQARLHKDVMADMRKQHRKRFLDTVVPRSADIERMGEKREPVLVFARKRVAGKASRKLCEEVLAELERR